MVRPMKALLCILSVFSVSSAQAESPVGAPFFGSYEGSCVRGSNQVENRVYVPYDRSSPGVLRIQYFNPEVGSKADEVSLVSNTSKVSTSPYPDAYDTHEVTIQQRVYNGSVQTVLTDRSYSHRRSLGPKSGTYRIMTLVAIKSPYAREADQLIIQGGAFYSKCSLKRIK